MCPLRAAAPAAKPRRMVCIETNMGIEGGEFTTGQGTMRGLEMA